MEYKVIGQTVPLVEAKLNKGESMYTQSGGMAYETNGVEMQTNTRGGVMKGFGRMFAGESMFMANYTALEDNQLVAFASTVPGNIIPINMDDFKEGLIVQKNAFLCAQQSVNMNIVFTKRFGAGLFGGEGFIL